jgi:hypothetical protein
LPSSTSYKRSILYWAIFLCLQIAPPIFAAQQESPQLEPQDSFAAPRRAMVERDLRGRGVKDPRVLSAMEAVPRHLFVPENLRSLAYDHLRRAVKASRTRYYQETPEARHRQSSNKVHSHRAVR